MKDPLTKKEHRDLLILFRMEYLLYYNGLLRKASYLEDSPIMKDGMPLAKHSHVLAKMALREAAKSFPVIGYKKLQKELLGE